MKILVIRGQNLASLAGRFEVSLEADPLASAGLFAIVGETGSGKTTLLDAMCAALFDKTPRLEGHSGFKVGHGDDEKLRLGTSDVRALVRNGETGGWAEVDFEGRDRRRYRARWEVQRARKKLDGRWQDQRMKLTRLDDNVQLGGTRTETLLEIRRVLGLSYDEFCRSALLAQFQFARFLKASASERAELLERMTGTRIYGDLSKAAFARARALGEERQRLADAVAAVAVLDDEARAAAERDERSARAEVERGKVLGGALASASAWRERAAALRDDVADGDAGERAARQRRAEAEPRARELVAVERVEPVREPWRARRDATVRMIQAEQTVDKTAIDVTRAVTAERHAGERVAAARTAVSEAARLATAAAPVLARARVLDAQRAEAGRRAEAAAMEAASAGVKAKTAAERASRLADDEQAAAKIVKDGERWLGTREAMVRMAREPARWRALLDRVVSGRVALDAARTVVDTLAPRVMEAESARAKAEAAVAQAHGGHEQAKAAAATAETAAREAPLAPAERALEVAAQRDAVVAALAAIAAQARRAVDDEGRHAAAAAEERRTHEAALTELAEVGARLGREDAARGEAEETLVRLRRAAGHEAERAELRDGEACAVCGATEHPWRGGVVDAMVRDQKQRVDELRLVAAELRRVSSDAEVRARLASGRADEREVAAAAAAQARAAAVEAWRDALAEAGELPLVGAPASAEAAAWLDGAAREAAGARAKALTARDAARALAGSAVARQAAALAALHDRESAREERERARDAAVQLAEQKKDAERALAEHGRVIGDARAELADVLSADDQRRLERDPAPVRERVMSAVTACAERLAAVTAARETLVRVQPLHAAARASADALAASAGERATAADELRGELTRLRDERATLLEGRAADVVERELATVRDGAAAEETAAAGLIAAAGKALSSAQSRHEDAVTARTAAVELHAAAAAALARALAAVALSEAEAPPLLARDAIWLTGARTELAALVAAVTHTAAIAAERRRLAVEHEARRSAVVAALTAAGAALDDDEQDWQARVTESAERAESVAARLRALELTRQGDDAARARRVHAVAAAAAHEVIALPYEQLSAVIGSGDGKELRNFAQSLSLDALLAAANHHLDQLAPRYQLERVPGLDLELHVVDREMGGDARAVNSLSGGESFLVSLALALGLSSMAAADVEVRTLFIDEGFGSLDPATLDAALGVLDTLRAGGRQVGIVSHVAELEDRVAASVSVRAVGGGKSVVEVRGARS